MKLKILFEDENLLALEKPSGITVYGFVKILLKEFPLLENVGSSPRYGLIHRLDKETSGVILVAKSNKALKFFQKQFSASTKSYSGSTEAFGEGGKEKKVLKRYLALVAGRLKQKKGEIETLIGRSEKDRKKQAAFLPLSPQVQRKGKRRAKTYWKVVERFKPARFALRSKAGGDYTLLEVMPETGRRHQIRVHLALISHPIVGDKVYGFKDSPCPENLKRLFLHATYLKIKGVKGEIIEIESCLPDDLKEVLKNLS